MKKIKVGITGIGGVLGQAIIKSIKNSYLNNRIRMVGFDYFKDTIGSFWVEKDYVLPDVLKEEVSQDDWAAVIADIIKKEKIRILFTGIDFETALFARYRDTIESAAGCKIVVSGPRVVEIADDKYLTYKFLKDNNFYHPRTFLSEQLPDNGIKFPCIMKPRKGTGAKGVGIINNRQELDSRLPLAAGYIIQEIIGGPDSEYTCGVIFFDNEVKRSICLRRALQYGNTKTAYFSKDVPPAIYDYVSMVTKRLKPFGPCNFQLRVDADKRPKIFEINARHSGTTYIRALFGFKEVEYVLSYLFGLRLKKFNLREGVVRRYYEESFSKIR